MLSCLKVTEWFNLAYLVWTFQGWGGGVETIKNSLWLQKMLFWLFPLVTSCCYASLSGFFIFLSACLQASYTMLTSWTCLGSLDLCSQTLWCTAREPNQALLVGGWVCYKVDNQQKDVYMEVVSCLTHMSLCNTCNEMSSLIVGVHTPSRFLYSRWKTYPTLALVLFCLMFDPYTKGYIIILLEHASICMEIPLGSSNQLSPGERQLIGNSSTNKPYGSHYGMI